MGRQLLLFCSKWKSKLPRFCLALGSSFPPPIWLVLWDLAFPCFDILFPVSRCSMGREIKALWQCGWAGGGEELAKGLLTSQFLWDWGAAEISHTWGLVTRCRQWRVKTLGLLAGFALDTVRLLSCDREDAAPHGALQSTFPPAPHTTQISQITRPREAPAEGSLSLPHSF